MKLFLELFLTFAKIGVFTIGGGYAMIPFIENICVEQKQWITMDEMMEITVIAESTPGPIAVNCATYVGYKQKGFTGALAATVGMILPSFCIIFAISGFLDHFLEITWIAHAFQGIKAAVGILILDAAIKMFRKMQKKADAANIHALCLCGDAADQYLLCQDFIHYSDVDCRTYQPVHLYGQKACCVRR